jgi:predicted LPLAT superfamily acyltransferase
MAERKEHSQWKGTTGGTSLMHQWLIRSLQILPLAFVYAGAAIFVVPFCMLFHHKGYLAQYHFFRRRLCFHRLRAFWNTYLDHILFAEIIIDRFYMYGGGRFHFDIDNYDAYLSLAHQSEGFVIVSAHIGNYEAAGYTLTAENKRFNALVYAGEVETIMKNRQRMFKPNNLYMIPISNDMSHLFLMSSALSNGESVSIPGDRMFGSSKHVTCPFLNANADFPLGPFALATQREVPVLAIHVMKEGIKRYHIYIDRLHAEGTSHQHQAMSLARQFSSSLEKVIRRYPTQWFNYYEFWND